MIKFNDAAIATFVRGSNKIEGIDRDPSLDEISVHQELLRSERLSRYALCDFVYVCAGAPIRGGAHQNVSVGRHVPPQGGEEVVRAVDHLLKSDLNPNDLHDAFLWLHPFMDGNGRASRLLWLWKHIQKRGFAREPFRSVEGFLTTYLTSNGIPDCEGVDFYELRQRYYDHLESTDHMRGDWFSERGFRFTAKRI